MRRNRRTHLDNNVPDFKIGAIVYTYITAKSLTQIYCPTKIRGKEKKKKMQSHSLMTSQSKTYIKRSKVQLQTRKIGEEREGHEGQGSRRDG